MANTTSHHMLDVVMAHSTRVIAQRHIRELGFDRFIQAHYPAEMDALVLQMVCMFAADKLQDFEFTRPLDWWEAVKERFAPAWFLTRYPVRRHVDRVEVKAIWAGYKPATDKYGPFLPYVLQRSEGP